ncbi:MAG: metalloregulator ArsR/SmtB family transcription factor [Anaerolineales bacterium]|nr:metalloregulator ArsR/SmtB family transcription factor [Anaerolineales bacterium]
MENAGELDRQPFSEQQFNELLDFFKILADANRLKIVGLLAQSPLSVEQIANMLDLHSSTVSHHLSRLSKAGLVRARAEGYYNIYQLEIQQLEGMAKSLLARETLPAVAAEVDIDAYDRKVLNTYLTPDGRLKQFPSQQKKLEVILRHVAQAFEPGARYSEKQVNQILERFNQDTASLRRHLVEFGLMGRQGGGGEYWRIDKTRK